MPVLVPRYRRARFAQTPVALVAIGLLHGTALAQDALPAPALQPSPMLRETIPSEQRDQLPTFVEGDRITGRTELDTSIQGNAQLRRGDTVIRADRLDYLQAEDLARARGNVRINRAGNVFEGPELEMRVEAFEGFFTQPSYSLLPNGAHGQAERIDFIDKDRSVVRNATYTTCEREPGPSWPAWILTARNIELDNETDTGFATGAVVRFYGVPILPVPALSFPLSDKRRSGLLPPTVGVDSRSGVELRQPYYWDIAPNRDATVTPTFMSKRGLDLGAEFRYLEPVYRGTLRTSWLGDDKLRERDRWAYSLRHEQVLGRNLVFPGGANLYLNLNRVSDDNYWRDFNGNVVPTLTERLLASDASVIWGAGPLGFTARALKWQTLQDVTAPITPPYDRLPQLQARYTRSELPGGLVSYVETDYTHFQADPLRTRQPDGERSYLMGQLSRPWQAPGWFITPRVQWHATQYQFDAPLAGSGRMAASRTVPTYSLDSGVVFERETRFGSRDLVQTLEPRAFYVYTPFRDQADLPNYDSGLNDFNFATVFTENEFGGHDRIADNNLLTLGLTSRLQEPSTGAELLRLGVAQRLRFKDQRVTLPGGTPAAERLSDLLLGATVNWSPRWTTDATVQYNPKTSRSERSTIGARYQPGPYRVLNVAYRLKREQSEQIDLGWQWPLQALWGTHESASTAGRWYSVGRLDVSLRERRVVDAIMGLEYDGCCWIGRVVLQRKQYETSSATSSIQFQLEFVGFTRLGTNVLGALRENIPRYQGLREQVTTPSRFTNYD